jgi:hypothetical protein
VRRWSHGRLALAPRVAGQQRQTAAAPALVPSGYLLALLLLVLAPPAILGWLAGAVVVRFGWVSRGRSAAAGGGATGALALLVIGPTVAAGSLLGAMAAWAGSGHPDRRRARGPRRDPDRAAPVPARPGPGPRRRRRRGPGDCGGPGRGGTHPADEHRRDHPQPGPGAGRRHRPASPAGRRRSETCTNRRTGRGGRQSRCQVRRQRLKPGAGPPGILLPGLTRRCRPRSGATGPQAGR